MLVVEKRPDPGVSLRRNASRAYPLKEGAPSPDESQCSGGPSLSQQNMWDHIDDAYGESPPPLAFGIAY
eukprot:2587134-Pyramimonas_sp.AAC.1